MKRKSDSMDSVSTKSRGSAEAQSREGSRRSSKRRATSSPRESLRASVEPASRMTRSASTRSGASKSSNADSAVHDDGHSSTASDSVLDDEDDLVATVDNDALRAPIHNSDPFVGNDAGHASTGRVVSEPNSSGNVSPKNTTFKDEQKRFTVPELRAFSPDEGKSANKEVSISDLQEVNDRLEELQSQSQQHLGVEPQLSQANTPGESTDATPASRTRATLNGRFVRKGGSAIPSAANNHPYKIEKRLPGRRRQPNPNVHVEAELRRQLELKTSFRTVAKFLKPLLAELAKRTIDQVENDPTAHERCHEFEEVKATLEKRLEERLELLEKTRQIKDDNLKKMVEAETEAINMRFANVVQLRQDDAVLRCKYQFLSTVREFRKYEETTEDEDGLIPRLNGLQYPYISPGPLPDKYDSRSRIFIETERGWIDEIHRQAVSNSLRAWVRKEQPEDESLIFENPKIVATFDAARRDLATAILNLEVLAAAAQEAEKTPEPVKKEVVSNAEALGLQLLVSAAESAVPLPIETPRAAEKAKIPAKKKAAKVIAKKTPAAKKHRFAPYTPKIKAAVSTEKPDAFQPEAGSSTAPAPRRQRHVLRFNTPMNGPKAIKPKKTTAPNLQPKPEPDPQRATKIEDILNKDEVKSKASGSAPKLNLGPTSPTAAAAIKKKVPHTSTVSSTSTYVPALASVPAPASAFPASQGSDDSFTGRPHVAPQSALPPGPFHAPNPAYASGSTPQSGHSRRPSLGPAFTPRTLAAAPVMSQASAPMTGSALNFAEPGASVPTSVTHSDRIPATTMTTMPQANEVSASATTTVSYSRGLLDNSNSSTTTSRTPYAEQPQPPSSHGVRTASKEGPDPAQNEKPAPHRKSFWSTVRRLSQPVGSQSSEATASNQTAQHASSGTAFTERHTPETPAHDSNAYTAHREKHTMPPRPPPSLPPPPPRPIITHGRKRSSTDYQYTFPALAPRRSSFSYGGRNETGQQSPHQQQWGESRRPSMEMADYRRPESIPTTPLYSPTDSVYGGSNSHMFGRQPEYSPHTAYPATAQPSPIQPLPSQQQYYGARAHPPPYESRAFPGHAYNPPASMSYGQPSPASYYSQPAPGPSPASYTPYAPPAGPSPTAYSPQATYPPPTAYHPSTTYPPPAAHQPPPTYAPPSTYPGYPQHPPYQPPAYPATPQYAGPQYGGQPILPANMDPRHSYPNTAPSSSAYAPSQSLPAFSQLQTNLTAATPRQSHPNVEHNGQAADSTGRRKSRGRGGFPNTEFRRYHGPRQR